MSSREDITLHLLPKIVYPMAIQLIVDPDAELTAKVKPLWVMLYTVTTYVPDEAFIVATTVGTLVNAI